MVKSRNRKTSKIKKEVIKKNYELAKSIVKNLDESYRKEAFTVIFAKLLNNNLISNQSNQPFKVLDDKQFSSGNLEPLQILSKECNTSIEKIKNIFDYENGKFSIPIKIDGKTDLEKQINVCKLYLTATKKGLKQEYVSSSVLVSFLKEKGLNTAHLNANLSSKPSIFLMKGKHGKGKKYGISTDGTTETINWNKDKLK